eukprot:4448547-Amphidinium_carterae.1
MPRSSRDRAHRHGEVRTLGPIPGSLDAPAVLLSHNLLEGSIPRHLLDGRDALEKWVAARTSES